MSGFQAEVLPLLSRSDGFEMERKMKDEMEQGTSLSPIYFLFVLHERLESIES